MERGRPARMDADKMSALRQTAMPDAAPSLLHRILDPIRFPPEGGEIALAVLLGLAFAGAGLWLIWRVLRRIGFAGGALELDDAIFALPLVLLVWLLFSGVAHVLGVSHENQPLAFGLLQLAAAVGAIVTLALAPWQPRESKPDWLRFRARWLPRVGLAWVLAYPMLIGASLANAAVLVWLSVPVREQELIAALRGDDSPLWIAGWYLTAAVAAPLAEEFAFRVVLFGAVLRGLLFMGKAAPWIAGALSVSVFVLAHGVIAQPVLILPLTVLAIVLTLSYIYTKSMWPGVILHALHNGLVVTLQFFVMPA
jgi:membrane protease YdiL (CAAX protease family)